VNCEQVEEYISALCDAQKIPPAAAEHIGGCQTCQLGLREYALIGVELRRLASLESPDAATFVLAKTLSLRAKWLEKGRQSMRIPKFVFALMLVAMVILSSGVLIFIAGSGGLAVRRASAGNDIPDS